MPQPQLLKLTDVDAADGRVPGRVAARGPVAAIFRRLARFFRPVAEGQGLIAAAPAVTLSRITQQLRPLVKPYRPGIVALALVAVALPAIETVEIWLFQRVVDDVLVPMTLHPLRWISIIYVGLSLTAAC